MNIAKRSMFLCLAIILIVSVAVTACGPAKKWGTPEEPIVITFVPSGDTGKITKAGTQIADWLSKKTGLSFKIEVGTSFGASIEAMGAQKAQIGFLNTFSVLLAEQKYGVIPAIAVVRKYATPADFADPDASLKDTMQTFYKGEFLTKANSDIKTLADVKGKTFCFVDSVSTSGYVVPNMMFKAIGIDPTKDFKAVVNAGGHDKVAIAVYKGDCDAGVAYIDIRTDAAAKLQETYTDIATALRVFGLTERIPNDGVQYIKQLDPATQKTITDALMEMSVDATAKQFLKDLYNINGYQRIDATFYDNFAALLKKAGVDPATMVK